jgi:hypothetical protein
MLHGQGLKLNAIVDELPLVTDANLDAWADAGWSLNTPGAASGEPQSFLSSKFLDAFFAHPRPLPARG